MRPRGIAAAGALLFVAGCASAPAAAPALPPEPEAEYRLTDDVIDRIADRVAAKLRGADPRDPLGAGSAPASRTAAVYGPFTPLRDVGRADTARRVDAVAGATPAPVLTEAEIAAFRDVVPLALGWLAASQEPDGRWSAARHGGEAGHDVGVTGLATLALLGAGNTTTSGEHAERVKKAVAWLMSVQDPDGCIGPRRTQHAMYDHGYAALALIEAYGMTRSPGLRAAAQRAADFIVRAQNPYLGWRYGIRDGDNDTTMTGLMVTVLKSARLAELAVDEQAFRGALSWFGKMTDPETGRVGYITRGGPPARTSAAVDRFPPQLVETPTAVACVARAFCGLDPATDPEISKGAALVAARPPRWAPDAGSIDFHWWYWGTLASFQRGGAEWREWWAHLVRALGANQVKRGPDAGTWAAEDPWTAEGGRVYATAMACLCAEIADRHRAAPR